MIERKDTRRLIAESLAELMGQRSIRDVTVNDIAQNCGISPRTFYYHFANKFELVEYVYEIALRENLAHWGDYRTVLLENSVYVADMGEYVRNITKLVPGAPDPLERMAALSVRVYRDIIAKLHGEQAITPRIEFELHYYNHLTLKAHVDWEQSDKSIPIETLVDWVMACMPDDLKPLLDGDAYGENVRS